MTIVLRKYIEKKSRSSFSGILNNIVQNLNSAKSIDLHFHDNFQNNEC